MNKFRKIAQNVLRNKWFQRYNVIKNRNLCTARSRKSLPRIPASYFKFAIASTTIPYGKINVEDDLRKAIEDGETAIVDLMIQLQQLIITASKEYRNCVSKQIEIIKATGDGASDELPQFRSLANELSSEINEYIILLKTLGEIAYDQTLISLKVDHHSFEAILRKYKELELLLLQELEANKRKELELLEINISNIASD